MAKAAGQQAAAASSSAPIQPAPVPMDVALPAVQTRTDIGPEGEMAEKRQRLSEARRVMAAVRLVDGNCVVDEEILPAHAAVAKNHRGKLNAESLGVGGERQGDPEA